MPQEIHSLRVGEGVTLVLGFGISTLAVCARVYTKVRLTKTMKKEDYLSVLAWLFFLAYIALAIMIGKSNGSPEHIAYLSSIELTIYCPIMVTVKISILLQYISLLVAHRGTKFHYAVRSLIWTNAVFYTIITLLYIFEIWRLQMPWYKKSRILAVFSVGLFACIASILRLVYNSELTRVSRTNPAYQLDIDRIGLWATAEIAVGIIVGCLPALSKLFRHFSSKEAGSSSRFRILSGTKQRSWRRFFRKSTTPELRRENPSFWDRKLHSSKKPSGSSGAPYIETLDLTRNSLQFSELNLPTMPAPVCGTETLGLGPDGNRENGRNADIESALPTGCH